MIPISYNKLDLLIKIIKTIKISRKNLNRQLLIEEIATELNEKTYKVKVAIRRFIEYYLDQI